MENPVNYSMAGSAQCSLTYSIIMHIYNEEPHLKHVFDALNRQTLTPKGIYVIDDGSTDRTPDIIYEYGYTHKHLHQGNLPKHIRRANAFNEAVNLAKQHNPDVDALLKVDGDIQVYDTYAEYTLKELEKDPRLAACSGVSVRYIKTRDLNNGAVMYRLSTLPQARKQYAWDRDIQLRLVANGYRFHVITTLGYGEMRIPTVSYGPGLTRVVTNRSKSRVAELLGWIRWYIIGVNETD